MASSHLHSTSSYLNLTTSHVYAALSSANSGSSHLNLNSDVSTSLLISESHNSLTFTDLTKLLNVNMTNGSHLPDLDLNDLDDLDLHGDDAAFYYEGENIDNLLKPWTNERYFIPTVSVYGVAFLLGLVGNSLVIFAMLGDKKARSTTASFMVSLAVADLLFLLVCVPHETAKNFIGHWDTGTIFCKVSGAVEMLSALASVLNLMAVSIERYMVIVHPMKARSWCTVENTKKMLPCVWVVALGLSSPTLYVWNTVKTVYYNNVTTVTVVLCADTGVDDHDRLVYSIYQFLIMFVIPVLVLLVCYVFVIHALWLSSRQLLQMTSHDSNYSGYSTVSTVEESVATTPENEIPASHSSNALRHSHLRSRRCMLNKATREHSAEVFRARKQVIKMLITIVLVFLICWGPKLLLTVFQRVGFSWMYNQWAYTLKIVINLLPFIHSCLNPIIYGFMSKNFRSRMKCACRIYVCRKSRYIAQLNKRQMAGSDHELDTRSTNGTVHTKISLRHGSSSQSET